MSPREREIEREKRENPEKNANRLFFITYYAGAGKMTITFGWVQNGGRETRLFSTKVRFD